MYSLYPTYSPDFLITAFKSSCHPTTLSDLSAALLQHYPATTSSSFPFATNNNNFFLPTSTTSSCCYDSLTTASSSPLAITSEIIEAEKRKLTELEQQLVTQLLQASICKSQFFTYSPPSRCPSSSSSSTSTTATSTTMATSGITKKSHPRPHSCTQCGKRFRFHSNLVEHRTVHFDGSEHYYSCPFCPKKCRLKGNLKKHLHRHFKTQFEVDEAWHQLYGGRSKHPSESSSSTTSSSKIF